MPVALGGVPIGVPPAEPGCPPARRLRVGSPAPAGKQTACLCAVHSAMRRVSADAAATLGSRALHGDAQQSGAQEARRGLCAQCH